MRKRSNKPKSATEAITNDLNREISSAAERACQRIGPGGARSRGASLAPPPVPV